jgi:hypothetical protein
MGDWTPYFRAYRTILLAAGVIGILMPVGLILGDRFFLDAPFELRDSISSYYYSPLRDLFVGSLCVIGVLLITYEWPGSGFAWAEFVISSLAGFLLLLVAFCPTEPPGLPHSGNHCKVDDPTPAPCTALQHHFGDNDLYKVHIPSAILALGLLAVLAVVFARHESRATPPRMTLRNVHFLSAGVIVLGLIVAGIGFKWNPEPIWQFQWVYVGEVIALLGFGFGWVVRGICLRAPADP